MSQIYNVIIHWEGMLVEENITENYIGGKKKRIQIRDGTSFFNLKEKIARKIGLNQSQVVETIVVRLPTLSSTTFNFTYVQICDDEDLAIVYDTVRSLSQRNLIEIYVEIGEINICGETSSYQPVDVNMEIQEQDIMVSAPTVPLDQYERQDINLNIQPHGYDVSNYHGGMTSENNWSAFDLNQTYYSYDINTGLSLGGTTSRYSVDGGVSNRQPLYQPRYSVDVGAVNRQTSNRINIAGNIFQHENDNLTGEVDVNLSESEDAASLSATDDEAVPIESHSGSGLHPSFIEQYSTAQLDRMIVNDEHMIHSHSQSNEHVELKKGMRFDSKEQLIAAVKRYSIAHHVTFHVTDSNKEKWIAVCQLKKNNCAWRIRGSKRWLNQKWEIAKYEGEHTCLSRELRRDHNQMDTKFLALELEDVVKEDVTVKVKVLMSIIHQKYKYMPSYRKTWLAKDLAIQRLHGRWDESYTRLPFFLKALKEKNPYTVFQWQYWNHSPDGTSIVHTAEDMFHRFFWAFYPCIMGFKFCRPVLSVDATFLYGKYTGTLLMATGVDGGNHIIPLGFAIVESENESAWFWFLNNIKQFCTFNRRLCIVSDRNIGLINVLRGNMIWADGEINHRLCARHLAANAVKHCKEKSVSGIVKAIAYEYQIRKFDNLMQHLKDSNPLCYQYLTDLDTSTWTAAYDGGHRYGIMTTNIAESVNGILKEIRQLPITALVAATFARCVKYFTDRRHEYESQTSQAFPAVILDRLKHWVAMSTGHQVQTYNRQDGLFSVRTRYDVGRRKGGHEQVVNLNDRTCTCGKFQGFHIPCSHAIAACREVGVDFTAYIHNWYSLEYCARVYAEQFYPPGDENYWSPYTGRELVANPARQRRIRGRPKSSRIHNEMDLHTAESRQIICSICGQRGHNRRRCTSRIR